uniref:Uncharacterized protein n=1 Tax=Panagrolaimus sp. JU765 TaxID=591449 RepID=A0AC34QZP6_9BILA
MTCLSLFQFDKALDLAVKSKMHVDTVLGYRQRYLEKTGRKETDPKYLKQLAEVEIDWQHIQEKVKEDYEKEKHGINNRCPSLELTTGNKVRNRLRIIFTKLLHARGQACHKYDNDPYFERVIQKVPIMCHWLTRGCI